jgi:hypothetical protein
MSFTPRWQSQRCVLSNSSSETAVFLNNIRRKAVRKAMAFSQKLKHGVVLSGLQEYLQKFSAISDWRRRRYVAMVNYLDDSVGAVVDALTSRGVRPKKKRSLSPVSSQVSTDRNVLNFATYTALDGIWLMELMCLTQTGLMENTLIAFSSDK